MEQPSQGLSDMDVMLNININIVFCGKTSVKTSYGTGCKIDSIYPYQYPPWVETHPRRLATLY